MEAKVLTVLWMIFIHSRISDCFQWSVVQQSSHVVNAYIGSSATLPCQFILSYQEQQQSQQFHLIMWSREKPFRSKSWEGLTTKTHISGLNQSLPQNLLPNSYAKYRLINNSLRISNLGIDDDTQYQCEVKSSFYTTPSVIRVNIVYKPTNTKIFGPSKVVEHKSRAIINCTATGNPKPGFSFFHNNKLVQNSTSHQYVVNVTTKEHEGKYWCVPWNYYGQGPNASLAIQVEDVKVPPRSKVLSDEMIAGIAGGAALLVMIIVVFAIMCKRFRSDKQENKATAKPSGKNSKDVPESHIGPGIYGSDVSIDGGTSAKKSRNSDLSQAYIGPGIYGSDLNISQSNGSFTHQNKSIIYGSTEDTAQANGKYTPQEPKLYHLNGLSNGPVDSHL